MKTVTEKIAKIDEEKKKNLESSNIEEESAESNMKLEEESSETSRSDEITEIEPTPLQVVIEDKKEPELQVIDVLVSDDHDVVVISSEESSPRKSVNKSNDSEVDTDKVVLENQKEITEEEILQVC